MKQLGIVGVATVDLYVCQISTRFYRFWLFVYHTGLHLSYMVMRSSANSIEKTWNSFLSPLTPGHDLDRCYRHYSPPPTTPVKNLGTPHTLTPNITDPMPTSCMNVPPNHHAHLGSSHSPTSNGRNLHHQQDWRSLVTLILQPHQASIIYNSLDLAYLRHTAHYFVMPPVHSNFIPQPLHLTSTLSSLWKIYSFLN